MSLSVKVAGASLRVRRGRPEAVSADSLSFDSDRCGRTSRLEQRREDTMITNPEPPRRRGRMRREAPNAPQHAERT